MTAVTHEDLFRRGANAPAGTFVSAGAVLAVIGLAAFAMFVFGDDPGRAWRVFHVNFLFFSGLSTGAVIFSAVQKIVKGRWAGGIVRFAEAASAFMPISLVCFLLLFLGRNELFPWIEHPTPARGNWLTVSWVFWRDLFSLLLVYLVAIRYVMLSLRPDVARLAGEVDGWKKTLYQRIAGGYAGTPEQYEENEKKLGFLAPVLILLYAYLFSVIAFDLVMSLAPYWFSHLYGAYYFMGSFLCGLTMLGVMMVYWRGKLGMDGVISSKTFHDLAKLVFGFTVFWAYLTYSQIIVLWYGNLPEDTSFLFYRLWGDWRPIALAVGFMVFLIPFWGLIWVKAKITPITFTLFLSISLAGMWLERYIMVQPSLTEEGPMFGVPEIGVTLGFLGLFLLAYGLFARAFPMVSPRLVERQMEAAHH